MVGVLLWIGELRSVSFRGNPAILLLVVGEDGICSHHSGVFDFQQEDAREAAACNVEAQLGDAFALRSEGISIYQCGEGRSINRFTKPPTIIDVHAEKDSINPSIAISLYPSKPALPSLSHNIAKSKKQGK